VPDVLYESARTDYDDAGEVMASDECEEAVGVATFAVDRAYDGSRPGPSTRCRSGYVLDLRATRRSVRSALRRRRG
jgi:hypothetical protein